MKKISYTSPIAEVITLDVKDIIATSNMEDIYEGEIDGLN